MMPKVSSEICLLVSCLELQTWFCCQISDFSEADNPKCQNKQHYRSRLNVQVLKSVGGGGSHMKELIQTAENTSPCVFLWEIYPQIITVICGSNVTINSDHFRESWSIWNCSDLRVELRSAFTWKSVRSGCYTEKRDSDVFLKVLLREPPLLRSVEEHQRGPALDLKLGPEHWGEPGSRSWTSVMEAAHRISAALQVSEALHQTLKRLSVNVLEQDGVFAAVSGRFEKFSWHRDNRKSDVCFCRDAEVALDFSPPASSLLLLFCAENT